MKKKIAQLLAKDEESQNAAAFAFKSLAKQCSEEESISSIVKHLFDLFKGNFFIFFYVEFLNSLR